MLKLLRFEGHCEWRHCLFGMTWPGVNGDIIGFQVLAGPFMLGVFWGRCEPSKAQVKELRAMRDYYQKILDDVPPPA